VSALDRLDALVRRGALDSIDLHFARAVAGWGGAVDAVVLAAALLSRLSAAGHVCLDLAQLADTPLPFAEDWCCPGFDAWRTALREHPACADAVAAGNAPLILDDHRLYLARHWRAERFVAAALISRARPLAVDEARLNEGLASLFPAVEAAGQRAAAGRAAKHAVAIVSGGPGTGKTTALAALLALTAEQSAAPLRMLLAAPTGKAAARMQEALRTAKACLAVAPATIAALPERAQTLHRLLGLRPDGSVRHDVDNPLACDLLVIDEASMVDLSLMAKTLAALPASARLVLVGDRDQLASVEAGAVFADICQAAEDGGCLQPLYSQLEHSFRFGDDAGIARLARLLRAGDGAAVEALLERGAEGLGWHPQPDATALLQAAVEGYRGYLDAVHDGAPPLELLRRFGEFRLLAAHRHGCYGVERLNVGLERIVGIRPRETWYAGRPIMVAENDAALGLFNGDIGIAVVAGGELRVAFEGEDGVRMLPPQRLPRHETAWAMTVHKSQGSEFDRVLLALPEEPSPILTRELLYTAVTRARREVSVWASAALLRQACQRSSARYSGLAGRLG